MARKIVFRMDDICPQMDHPKFERMRKIFDQYDVKPIIGVVPDCKDPVLSKSEENPHFWEMVRQLQESGWTIAMHGCYHQYVTKKCGLLSGGFRSEFAGLSYEEQYQKLQYGRDKLREHGIETDVFMAPSHSFDKNTVRALKDLGFRCITDGLTARPYTYMGMLFVPCIDSKIIAARRFSTVCYHTNTSAEARFQETEKILSQHREQVITFDQARAMKPMPYWRARPEELLRYVYKYYIREGLYRLLRRGR
jgi:predicted deacetylase